MPHSMHHMTHSYMWYVSCIYVKSGTSYLHDSFIPATTHSYVTCLIYTSQDSYIPWLIHIWNAALYTLWLIRTCHNSFICDMSYSIRHGTHTCHDSWIFEMHHSIRHMTHSYMWYVACIHVTCGTSYLHDSFIPSITHSCVTYLILYVTWLIHICDMSHAYMWHVLRSIFMTHSYLPWLIHMRHASFTDVTRLIDVCQYLTHT